MCTTSHRHPRNVHKLNGITDQQGSVATSITTVQGPLLTLLYDRQKFSIITFYHRTIVLLVVMVVWFVVDVRGDVEIWVERECC